MDIKIRILERAGYSVKSALGCKAAFEILNDYDPDCIILESGHPDGCEIEFMRELDETRDIPVMFLSEKREDEVNALRAGADDFLRKPFNFDVLLARMALIINKNGHTEVARCSDEPDMSANNHENTNDAVIVEAEANNQDTQQETRQDTQPDTQQDTVLQVQTILIEQERTNKFKRKLIVGFAALCAAVFLAVGGMFLLLGERPQEVDLGPGDEQLPLAGFPFVENDTESHVVPTLFNSIQIPGIEVVHIQADSAVMTIDLANIGTNPCNFIFELVLTNTSEVLYKSEIIPPGMSISQITLNRVLEKGEHSAELVIYTFSLEDSKPTGCIRMGFTITAV